MSVSSPKPYLIPALLLGLLVVTALIYSPGLSGEFIFDDYRNIFYNDAAQLNELSLSEIVRVLTSGVVEGSNRPLSMLSFGINNFFTGLDPFYFKLVNVLLHLMVTCALYRLTSQLLMILPATKADPAKVRLFALVITACWAVHPLNVSTVLYVVQRMTQLSALVTILGLSYYCHVRTNGVSTTPQVIRTLAALFAFTVIAVLFKENGALLVLFIALIEFFGFRFQHETQAERFFLKYYFSLFLALPALVISVYLVIEPGLILDTYAIRTFGLGERLLTESRALWMYIGWIVLPDISQFTFYHDTYPVSDSLFSPLSTLASLFGLTAIVAFIAMYYRKLPLLCFGLCWFLVGHSMESTVVGLELVFEHRNYLPAFGLLFGVVGSVLSLPRKFFSPMAAGLLLFPYLLFLGQGTYLESIKWSNTSIQLLQGYSQHPESYRINYSLARYYLRYADPVARPEFFVRARDHYEKTDKLQPGAIRGLIGILLVDTQSGRAPSKRFIDEMTNRIKTTSMDENFIVDLAGLTECQVKGRCQLDPEILLDFFRAILDNEMSASAAKSAILADLIARISEEAPNPLVLASLNFLKLTLTASSK